MSKRPTSGIPDEWLYWRHNPVEAHLTVNCTRAFMEAPARWGEERMGNCDLKRAMRLNIDGCPECGVGFLQARQSAVFAEHNRELMLVGRRLRREMRAKAN